ncbi:MAG TPA: YdcF family protein [Gaiellaceae bacterium]|nr:YdcF family protein [Gaiellaceae bacterium]
MRLVVVLGYSDRRGGELHPVCAARVLAAAEFASADDAIVFTGRPEAELMRQSWNGASPQIVLDTEARTTAESARHAARIASDLGADDVVVVTSWWHCRRAALLFRRSLARTGATVTTLAAPRWTPRLLAREAGAFLLLPLHVRRVRGRTP